MIKRFSYLFGIFILAVIGITDVQAHAVQVGYCTNCNGDLRIWIEHWHNNQNPNSTTMNIELNVNGNITYINGSPDTSVIGVPIGQLPGCFTPLNVFSQCQGTGIYAPNAHNDWVAYDFPGVQCGVPVEITVISGNTVFTQDCGSPVNMFPASSGQFTIPCQTNQLPDDTVCAGNPAGPYLFPAGNTWTNSNPAIGLGANGAGDISFTAANVSVPTTGSIVVNNTCGVETFDITVVPGPIADFSAQYGCSNATPVTFINNSTSLGGPITSYSWDFGDGSPVYTGANPPPHNYPGNGPYNVTLTVGTPGCDNDTTITINFAPPIADFSFTSPCFGAVTNFVDQSSGGITSWAWDFDNNGTIDDTTQNPTNGFPSSGLFNVKLIVEAGVNCTDTIVKQVSVNPLPSADFDVDTVCVGGTSTFTDLSAIATGNITNWSWDFGDGIGTSNAQNPTYVYAGSGVYPVTLTITSDSGCINTVTDSAYVNVLPTAAFNTADVCMNQIATFTDASNANGGFITNWDWDFQNDGIVDDNNQNPTYQYMAPGTYNVSLVVSAGGGCSDTIVQTIDIFDMPTADFNFTNQCFGTAVPFTDNSAIGVGNITGWAWDFDNGNTSVVQNPAENYGSEGVYNVELIVTSDNGCQDTITKTVEVYPIPVVNFSPSEVCLNTPTQFIDLTTISNANTPNNIVSWSWDFGDGIGTSNQQLPIYTYTQDGVFPAMLTVVSNNGCTNDTTINVTVNPLPVIDFEGPASDCAPVCVTFTNNSNIASGSIAIWDWDFGDGGFSTAMSPSHCFENESHANVATFDVSLTATSDKGCVTSMTKNNLITSYPMPLADFTYNPLETDIYDPEITFTDKSIIGASWDWDLGDGNTSTEQHPVHMYADSGTYLVTLYMENQYGCKDTAQKTVIIDPTFAIWIPNVFTPDGDGVNDFWFVDGYGIEELQTLVFDRWGVLVFEGYQLDSKWNGGFKGKMCVTDVYVYKVRAKDVFGVWHEFVGRVSLLR